MGLTSALLAAGVSRIVSSLWPVDDSASALLITRMYHNLLESSGRESLTSALSRAQIWLRQLSLIDAETALLCMGMTISSEAMGKCRSEVGQQFQRIIVNPLAQLAVGVTAESLAQAVAFQCPVEYCDDDEREPIFFARASPDPKSAHATKFTLQHWEEFYEAFQNKRATFVYSHLFPVAVANGEAMMPERDYWYRYTTGSTAALKTVVLHVHYVGPWAELDESNIAQINARWPNHVDYQFEPHGSIQSGIMTTANMFRVTAIETNPRKKNDPAKWMAGGKNEPPPWRWLEDPTRLIGCQNETITLPQDPGTSRDLKDVYQQHNVLQRFIQAHAVLKHGYTICMRSHISTFKFPIDCMSHPSGERRMDAEAIEGIRMKPFSSPQYWAGFVVSGDGARVEADGGTVRDTHD